MSVSCWYGCSDCDSSSLTGTMNYLWIVKDLLVIAVGLSSWNQPGLPPSWGNSGKQILISKSLIVGRKSAKRNCCGKMCRLRVVLWRLCGHSGSGCFSEQCALSQMEKWLRRTDNWPGYSSQKPLTDCFWISSYSCSLTTASHCCVTGQDLLQQFTYWSPGANLGKKASCSFKAVRVEAPMERITIDILGPLPETPLKEQIYTVG